jgi:hypothetical protein
VAVDRDADVPNGGTVRPVPAPDGVSTEVHIVLVYDVPGGTVADGALWKPAYSEWRGSLFTAASSAAIRANCTRELIPSFQKTCRR